MKIYRFSYFLLIIITIISCNKSDDENIYNFNGYIYNVADSTPYSNTTFKLYQQSGGGALQGNKTKEEVRLITTDVNGYFSTEFNVVNSLRPIHLCHSNTDNYDCLESDVSFKAGNNDIGILYVK